MLNRMSRFILLGFVSCLLAWGCGGGGGGGSRADLTAIADWTNFGQGLSGNSMRWSLFTLDENLVQSIAINRDSAGEQSAVIADLQDGDYHLRVELFASRDLSGSLVGEIDEQIRITGDRSYSAAIGTDPASLKVTPPTAAFRAGQGKQFYAALYNAAQKATFAAPGSFTWQTFGSVATVNSDGFVQGTAAGSGTVVATHVPSSLQGGATLTVQSANVTTSKWTVLVFMNAANDLYPFSELNMNQMEQVAGNPDVRFVVQWKQATSIFPDSSFNGTRRYLVKPDQTNQIASELVQNMGLNVDMGKKETMTDFINWAKTFYPAQRYCLVVWNHGNGWRRNRDHLPPTRAVSYDDEFNTVIQTWEFAQALGSNHFDILAWDASLMQMMEVSYEIQDQADYIVGSEESPPGAGYPYHLVFAPFRDNPDDTTLALSKSFVDGMIARYGASSEKITQSVVDTNELPALGSQLNALAQALIANQATLGPLMTQVRNTAKNYSPTSFDQKRYYDIWDLADKISAGTSITEIDTACDAVKAALVNAVKWEGHNTASNGSHGLSVEFSPATLFSGIASDYSNLRFASDWQWDEWLAVAP